MVIFANVTDRALFSVWFDGRLGAGKSSINRINGKRIFKAICGNYSLLVKTAERKKNFYYTFR